jgi:hypothetical protein
VRSIANAIYMAIDTNGGNFPSTGSASAVCLGTTGTCWDIGTNTISGSATIETLLQPYISQIPADPGRSSGKGDRFLYVDSNHNMSNPGCSPGNIYGPFIIWVPENNNPSTADCKNATFMACCGNGISCNYGYACAYRL